MSVKYFKKSQFSLSVFSLTTFVNAVKLFYRTQREETVARFASSCKGPVYKEKQSLCFVFKMGIVLKFCLQTKKNVTVGSIVKVDLRIVLVKIGKQQVGLLLARVCNHTH